MGILSLKQTLSSQPLDGLEKAGKAILQIARDHDVEYKTADQIAV